MSKRIEETSALASASGEELSQFSDKQLEELVEGLRCLDRDLEGELEFSTLESCHCQEEMRKATAPGTSRFQLQFKNRCSLPKAKMEDVLAEILERVIHDQKISKLSDKVRDSDDYVDKLQGYVDEEEEILVEENEVHKDAILLLKKKIAFTNTPQLQRQVTEEIRKASMGQQKTSMDKEDVQSELGILNSVELSLPESYVTCVEIQLDEETAEEEKEELVLPETETESESELQDFSDCILPEKRDREKKNAGGLPARVFEIPTDEEATSFEEEEKEEVKESSEEKIEQCRAIKQYFYSKFGLGKDYDYDEA